MNELKKVIVFVPAFNEEDSIESVIQQVSDLFPVEKTRDKGFFIQLLIVNDGSTDRTEEIAKYKGIEVISHPRNLGLGAATRTAMENAYEEGADIAIKLDADLQHDPADIEKVILPILENKADICWGSRMAGEITYKMPMIRKYGNRFFTWLMNILTDYTISDAQTGMMAFGRKYLSVFELHGNYNPPQQLLIDASSKFMRYMEVPVTFHSRKTGESFVSLKYPLIVILNIARVIIYANPLKVFSICGLGMIGFSICYFIVNKISRSLGWDLSFIFIKYLGLVTMILGVQTLFFGILADLIIKKRSK